LVVQRALPGLAAFRDASDRDTYRAALREAASIEQVQVHAYALLPHEVQLLLTPSQRSGLSRLLQAVGRRYVSAYNRRHGRSGTLWDGRFRCAVVEPGTWRLLALLMVDGAAADERTPPAGEIGTTSAPHRCGGARDPMLSDPPEVWSLGNTPFERETAYRRRLEQGVAGPQFDLARRAALGGWALGSPAFVEAVSAASDRPAAPRPRGRPARAR
jgi:putative transposase